MGNPVQFITVVSGRECPDLLGLALPFSIFTCLDLSSSSANKIVLQTNWIHIVWIYLALILKRSVSACLLASTSTGHMIPTSYAPCRNTLYSHHCHHCHGVSHGCSGPRAVRSSGASSSSSYQNESPLPALSIIIQPSLLHSSLHQMGNSALVYLSAANLYANEKIIINEVHAWLAPINTTLHRQMIQMATFHIARQLGGVLMQWANQECAIILWFYLPYST